jgi:hypothetical protein
MTTYTKATLATFFETGDVPTGTDYANLIDSQVNIAETSTQAMAGSLSLVELIGARVSAGNANIVGILSAAVIAADAFLVSSVVAATGSFTATVSAGNINVTTDVSAGGTLYANANRAQFNYHGTPVIVSAAGTAQTTAAILAFEFTRLQGATDGQTTGFRLVPNQLGWVQYLANECTVSANLWPPVGGVINGLAPNAAFGMAANTPYIIMHRAASAYSVK